MPTPLTAVPAVFTSTFSGDSAELLTSTEEPLMRQSPSFGRRTRELAVEDNLPPTQPVGVWGWAWWAWQKRFPLNSCHASDGRGSTLRKMLQEAKGRIWRQVPVETSGAIMISRAGIELGTSSPGATSELAQPDSIAMSLGIRLRTSGWQLLHSKQAS